MKEKLAKKAAKKTTSALETFLRIDANSASCCIMHQPKVPKELSRFKRIK